MNFEGLTVYCVLDCSGGMMGAPMEGMKQAVRSLQASLAASEFLAARTEINLITFGTAPQLRGRPADPLEFELPPLVAAGASSLGAALTFLLATAARQVKSEYAGWKSMAVLFTDGCATDDWESPAQKLRGSSLLPVVAIACGSHADLENLRACTDAVITPTMVTPALFERFLRWEVPAGAPPITVMVPNVVTFHDEPR